MRSFQFGFGFLFFISVSSSAWTAHPADAALPGNAARPAGVSTQPSPSPTEPTKKQALLVSEFPHARFDSFRFDGGQYASDVRIPKNPTFSAFPFNVPVTGMPSATASPTPDTDSGLSFCHTEKWSKSCLYGLFVYRCGQYAYPLTPVGCALAAASFVDFLDMKRIPIVADDGQTYNLPVIFTTKLVEMIQNRTIQSDLRDLRVLLEYYAKEKRKFDLHEWIRAATGGDPEKTYAWLAVLLQDTSAVQIQIAYLDIVAKEIKFSEETKAAIDNLAELSYFLSNENLKTVDSKSWLKLYPQTKNLDAELTPLVYHFYPMTYMAVRLRKAGYSARLSSFLPFLFNTEYELQSLDPEMWPLHHPRPEKIDLKLDYVQWKFRDIYGGMTGALWGVDRIQNAPGLVPLETTFAKNPFRTMQHLFWSFPSP